MGRARFVPVIALLVVVGCAQQRFGWSPEVLDLVDRLTVERAAELSGPAEARPVVV